MEGAPLPLVAIATPPEEVSSQSPVAFSAYVVESAESAAPQWKGWWLQERSNSDESYANAFLLQISTATLLRVPMRVFAP